MTLSITIAGSAIVLNGAVDVATAPSLRAELTDLITTAGPGSAVRVDLGGVSLVDSSGLSVLLAAHKLAASRDVRLLLVALPQHVARILTITGLDEILEIAPTSG
jgi:anti-anti-sigma factor